MFSAKNIAVFAATSILLSAAAMSLIYVGESAPSEIPWLSDYDDALSEARDSGRILVTYLHTDWCTYCRQMEATTFQDEGAVREVADRYVWLKLNAEEDPKGIQFQQEFRVGDYPTFLLMDEQGDEIDRLIGYVGPEEFPSRLETAWSAPDSLRNLTQRAEQNPDSAEARYLLAEKLFKRKDLGQATRDFLKVVELDPDNTAGYSDDSLYFMAQSIKLQNEYAGALEVVNTLKKRFPDSNYLPDAAILEAELLFQENRQPEAVAVLKQFLKDYPTHRYAAQILQVVQQQTDTFRPSASH